MENLKELRENKWFDDFQNGLSARFSASGLKYSYKYKKDIRNKISVYVLLANEQNEATIELTEDGDLLFTYSNNGIATKKEFIECSRDDFHLMLAHSFLYLRDGNFDHHQEWYNKLKQKEK